MENNKNGHGMQVISRAVSVLRVLTDSSQSLGTLAALTGLPRSTVQRLVDALAAEDLVEAGAGGVRLSWGVQHLAAQGSPSIIKLARPALEALFAATHETVDISAAQGTEVSFLDRIVSDQELRVVPFPDKPRPLYAMANGKSLLSALTDDSIRRLFEAPFSFLTVFTVTGTDKLIEEIQNVRTTGFSYDREEHALGVCGIGIPVIIPGHRPYALSVVMPVSRFEASKSHVEASLLSAREQILSVVQQ